MPIELGLQQPYEINQANVDKMFTAGAKWVRYGLDMSGVYPTQASYNADTPTYGNLASMVSYIHGKGMKILVTPAYNPGWLGLYHGKPTDNTIYARMCRRIVRDHPTVDAYEIWNEPNNPQFWANPSFVDYRKLLRACILDMRAQSSTCYIMNGGCATSGANASNDPDKYNATFDTGVPRTGSGITVASFMWGLFDPTDGIVTGTTAGTPFLSGYAFHCYTTAANLPTDLSFENCLMHIGTKFPGYGDAAVWGTNAQGKSNGYAFWDDIIFAKEGATSKLVWDTESGDLTDVNYGHYNPWTDQIMSDHMAQEFYVWSSRTYSGPKIWFLLHDDQSSGNDIWIQHAGLYHTDLTPKPLPLATFQQLSGIADTVKPVTEILVIAGASPVDGQVVSGQILLSASGSDNVTPQSQLVVRYYVDNVLVGTADVTVYGYIFTLDTTTLSNGVHTIVSKATDLASNVGVSTGHIVNVQNTGVDLVPPSCSWVSIGGQTPVNGLAIVGQQVQLVASVSDNVTPTDQIVVDFLVGNIVIGVATPPFTGGQAKYTWNSTGIPNGSVTMVARARDLANNVRNSDVISVYINNPVLKVPVPNQALVRFRTDSGDPVIGRPFGVGWSRREKRDGKTRGIILCHPYGDNGWGIFNSAAGGFDQLVLRPIINAGYTVICPQNGDGNASAPSGGQWGNDTAIASLTAARTWLQDSTKGAARPGRFAILCFSMGGAAAWNLARNLGTPTPVAGIISIDAATDLSWVRGTDQGHWKNFTVAAGTTTTIIRSSAAFFQSYMVGWQFSYPYGTGNLTARISAYTSSTQVSVTPPTQGVIANGVQPIVTPADGAGIFYQNINQAYGGNGADPDGVMNDAAWNAIKGTRDPALMVDTRSWMLDIPWFSSYGELDTFIGGSPQQKKLGNKLHYTNYSIDSAGIHGGIYVKAEDLITFLNGLDWQ